MRIHHLDKAVEGHRARVAGTVTWESQNRPDQEIYIETDVRFAEALSPSPDAFLLAAIMPAMYYGELRIHVDGRLCPRLRNGLITAMQQLRRWYGPERHEPVTIEAHRGFNPPRPRSPQRTASFFSGGVDSLATLRHNRQTFPRDHPGSIQDCFLVYGFDLGGYASLEQRKGSFERAVASYSELAQDALVTLLPVYTNMRHLETAENSQNSNVIFTLKSHGAAMAAIAHAFSPRITAALIASSTPIRSKVLDLTPWGSHPILDLNYSGSAVCIRHDGARFTRLQKVGLIADWDMAIRNVRACLDPFRPDSALNCGECEKCIRTMTELLVYGKLKSCRSYPLDDVTSRQLESLRPYPHILSDRPEARLGSGYLGISDSTCSFWQELVKPLREIGREDLARVIERKLAMYKRFLSRAAEKDWRGILRRMDRKYLGRRLVKLKHLLAGKAPIEQPSIL